MSDRVESRKLRETSLFSAQNHRNFALRREIIDKRLKYVAETFAIRHEFKSTQINFWSFLGHRRNENKSQVKQLKFLSRINISELSRKDFLFAAWSKSPRNFNRASNPMIVSSVLCLDVSQWQERVFKINTSRAAAFWDFGGFHQTKSQRDERIEIVYDFTYISRTVLTEIHCFWRLIIFTIHNSLRRRNSFVDAVHDLLNSSMFSLCTRHKQKTFCAYYHRNLHGQFDVLQHFVGELTAPNSRHVFYRKFDGAKELWFMCWITLDGVNNFLLSVLCVFFGTDKAQKQIDIDMKSWKVSEKHRADVKKASFQFSSDLRFYFRSLAIYLSR